VEIFSNFPAAMELGPRHTVGLGEVREMALAHTVGDKVEAAYRRGDMFERRRPLAEAWARYCAARPVSVSVLRVSGTI